MKRFIYTLTEEELGKLLAENPVPLEVIKREGNLITFALYQPLRDLRPVREEEIGEEWKNWKKDFGPVDVEDFVIIPPWKSAVFINPGLAFGTGLHPTTKMCIKMLKETIKPGYSVIDVGTGSGILAIISKLSGADYVLGIDVSKDALRACRENMEANGVEFEALQATPSQINETFDLVVANLETEIFKRELKNIVKLFRRYAIFSGIYKRKELETFLEMLEQEGLKADRIIEDEDWFCIGVGDGRN